MVELFQVRISCFRPREFSRSVPLCTCPCLPNVLKGGYCNGVRTVGGTAKGGFRGRYVVRRKLCFTRCILGSRYVVPYVSAVCACDGCQGGTVLGRFNGGFSGRVVVMKPCVRCTSCFGSGSGLGTLGTRLNGVLLIFPARDFRSYSSLCSFGRFSRYVSRVTGSCSAILVSVVNCSVRRKFSGGCEGGNCEVMSSNAHGSPCFLGERESLVRLTSVAVSGGVKARVNCDVYLKAPRCVFGRSVASVGGTTSTRTSSRLRTVHSERCTRVGTMFGSQRPVVAPRRVTMIGGC